MEEGKQSNREMTFKDIPVPIVIHNAEKRIVWANKTYLDKIGKSLEDVKRSWCYQILFGRSAPCVNCPVEKAFKEERSVEDVRLVKLKDENEELWILKAIPLKEGDTVKEVAVVAVEISDTHAKARIRIKEAEEKFRGIFDESTDAIIILDSKEYIQDCNPSAVSMLGYSREELIGKKISDIGDFFHSGDEREFLVREKYIPGKKQKRVEKRISLKHNGDVIAREGLLDLKSGQKLLLFHDVTEQRKAERELAQQFRTLKSLYQVVQRFAETLDQKEIANLLTKACVDILGAKLAWLCRAEEDGGVKVLSQYPEDHPYPKIITVRWDNSKESSGPTGTAIKYARIETVSNVELNSRFKTWLAHAMKYNLKSVMAIPLVSRNRTFGALTLYSDRPGFFDDKNKRETFEIFAHLASSALENARLMEENSRRIARMTALRNIDITIASSMDIRVAYRVVLDEVIHNLGVDAVSILRMNKHFHVLEFAAARGFWTSEIEKSRVPLGKGPAGICALEQRVVSIPDLGNSELQCPRMELLEGERFISYCAVPLIAKGDLLGVLEVFLRKHFEVDREWLEFLEMLANQTAIAINNAILFQEIKRKHLELATAYDATIQGWARALELREEETEEHCRRVTELTLELAKAMGVEEDELIHIWRGAYLHDIGKLVIPDSILLKPGKLTEDEWEIMKKHPLYAYEMLAPIRYLEKAIDIPYCHHERWDGKGYPRGLRGKEIPLPARIFAVVDVLDALTSDRPYRKAWSKEKALDYIAEQSGSQFDPDVVEVFLELIKKKSFK